MRKTENANSNKPNTIIVKEPIPDKLSISTCTRREICGETEFNLCKHKDEEE